MKRRMSKQFLFALLPLLGDTAFIDYGKVRWSRFDGQQCCFEYKRHDYEKGIIKIKTEPGNHDSSPAQI